MKQLFIAIILLVVFIPHKALAQVILPPVLNPPATAATPVPSVTPSVSPTPTTEPLPSPSPTAVPTIPPVVTPTSTPAPIEVLITPIPQETVSPTPTPIQAIQAAIERLPTPTSSPPPKPLAPQTYTSLIKAPVDFLVRSLSGDYYSAKTLPKILSLILTLFSGICILFGFALLHPAASRGIFSRFQSLVHTFFA